MLDTTLNKISKVSLKNELPNRITDHSEALNTLVWSMKKDKKASYRLYIKTKLSIDELQSTINYFDHAEITLSSANDDGNVYQVFLPYKGKFARTIGKYLEQGEVPTDLLPWIEIVVPTLVESIGDTSYLSGELLSQMRGITSIWANNYQKWLASQSKIKVGVIDTGIYYTHPDLARNMYKNPWEIAGNSLDDDGNGYVDDIYGYNFIWGNSTPLDDHNHGSHVAGVIGGLVNSWGIFGVNSNASLVALKSLDASGAGSSYSIVEAINYAANNGIKVVNMSLGGTGTPSTDIMCNAITQAKTKWVISIVSAGNSNADVSTVVPAGCSDAITVSAVDSTLTKASFSNYGSEVDVAAPWVSIYSTLKNNSYGYMNGTSMAAPFVTGLTSAILANNPSASYSDVKTLLMTQSEPTHSSVNIGNMISMTKVMTALWVDADGTQKQNIPPSVSLTKTKISLNTYDIQANATDSDGSIASYLFSANGTPVGTGSTYTLTITKNTTIWIFVTDNNWATASGSIDLIYENTPPTVSLSKTKNSSNNYTVTANATDSDGVIDSISFTQDENTVTSSGNTYTTTIDKNTTIWVLVTDDQWASTTGSIELAYNTIPIVTLDATKTSQNHYTISASGSDDGHIVSYKFIIDGTETLYSTTTFPLTITKDTTVSVIVTDEDWQTATDTKTLIYELPENILPTVSLESKKIKANQFTLIADAEDSDGTIVNYEYSINGEIVGTGSTYSLTISEDTFVIVNVTDNRWGTAKDSVNLIYEEIPNTLPTVSLTSKEISRNTYQITASGSDVDGSITWIQFTNNGEVVNSTGSTIQLTISQDSLIEVLVTDNDWATATGAISLVYSTNFSPKLSLVSTKKSPNSYLITASGSDSDGTIIAYQFKKDWVVVGTWNILTIYITKDTLVECSITDNEWATVTDTVELKYENALPTVSLTTTKLATNKYTVTAIAKDSDGTIESYAFFKEGILVGTGSSYTTNVIANSTLSVVVTDNKWGTATASTNLTYIPTPNRLPTVKLLTTKTAINSYSMVATASDSDGEITKYEFFKDNILVGTSATLNVTITTNSLIKVVVTDNRGGTATSSVSLKYQNNIPTVSLSTTRIGFNQYSVTANASDTDGTIVSYAIKQDGKAISTTSTGVVTLTRNSVLSVLVIDNLWWRATASTNLMYEIPPKVTLTSSKTALNSYILAANASVNTGSIIKYEFYKENALIGSDSTLSLNITANSTISVVVTDDRWGRATAYITLKYQNFPPTVSLTSIKTAMNQYTLTANATDSDGSIASYVIKQDGKTISTTSTATITLTKNSVITVVVTDNQRASATDSLQLTYELPPNANPTVNLTLLNSSSKTGYVSIVAKDSDGTIVNQKIYVNEKIVYNANLNTSSISRNQSFTKGTATVIRTVVTDNRWWITEQSITVQ